jgi:hypothetical protein
MRDPSPREPAEEAAPEASRTAVEQLIDDIVDDTFPASDPPAWGVAAARLERSREADQAGG